jgi:hypothetical protein
MVEDYTAQWRDYRRKRNSFLLRALVFFAAFFVASQLSLERSIVVAIFFSGAFIAMIAGSRLAKWKCPRCGNPFFGVSALNTGIYFTRTARLLARSCGYCGLRKFDHSQQS